MGRLVRDDIDKFFDYGFYPSTRTLYIGSAERAGDDDDDGTGTDFLMAERAIKALHILDAQSDKPITVILNNTGGDEYHGMAIYDAIRACRSHVTIKVMGSAMSMGSIILQAGDARILAPNSRIMIHYGSWGTSDHPQITYRWAEEGKRLDKLMEDLYLAKINEKQPGFARSRLKKLLNFDTILSPAEAVALGLADSIDSSRAKE